MNEMDPNTSFNENFLELMNNADCEKIKMNFIPILANLELNTLPDSLLLNGIKIAVLKAIITLLDRGTNPLATEILPEYKILMSEVKEAFDSLKPTKESNWMEECIAFGDKKAYHWEWKHYGSKELF